MALTYLRTMKVNFSLKEHFNLSRAELKGYLGFLFLLVCLATYKLVSKTIEEQKFLSVVSQIEANTNQIPSKQTSFGISKSNSLLDPNTCPLDTLNTLDLPQYLIDRIRKYRQAGGRFTKCSDLLNIYGLDSSHYAKIKARIELKLPSTKSDKRLAVRPQKPVKIVNINLCTSDEMRALRGIGPVLSKRTIRYRDLLGGFYEKKQLSEVYGISDSLYNALRPRIKCDGDLRMIELNTCSDTALQKHPYCGYRMADKIIRYRQVHEGFESLSQLYNIVYIDSVKMTQLIPYLVLGQWKP